MNESIANMTTGVASIGSFAGIGWLFTILIGIGISLFLMLLSKNIRRLIYGLPVVGGLSIIFFTAKSIGFSVAEGNLESLKGLLWVVGIITVSILTGKIIEHSSTIKKINDYFNDEEVKT